MTSQQPEWTLPQRRMGRLADYFDNPKDELIRIAWKNKWENVHIHHCDNPDNFQGEREPTKKYIVTEETIRFIEKSQWKYQDVSILRSCPYNPQAEELTDNQKTTQKIRPLVHDARIRINEREKVLDVIWKYFTDNDCQVHISPISGEKYYWISGTFSVSGLMRLVEELRKGEP